MNDPSANMPEPDRRPGEARGTLGLNQAALIVGSIIGVRIFNLPGSLAATARSACLPWR